MKKNNLLLSIAFVLLSALCFSQQPIDKEIRQLMEEGDIPGLSVVMINGDKQEIKTFGYSDLQSKQPVTAQTLFQIGSCILK